MTSTGETGAAFGVIEEALQTNADRTRVLEGSAQATGTGAKNRAALERLCKNLYPRWFILRDVRSKLGTLLFQPRWAMSNNAHFDRRRSLRSEPYLVLRAANKEVIGTSEMYSSTQKCELGRAAVTGVRGRGESSG